MNERITAIVNVIVELALLANAILTAAGKNPLPLNQDALTVTATSVLAGLDAVYCWWKNQNITAEAQTGQRLIEQMKADRGMVGGEGDPLGDADGGE